MGASDPGGSPAPALPRGRCAYRVTGEPGRRAESARVLGRAGDVLVHFRARPESVTPDDAILLREGRRDLEHARILLEGLCRTHRIDVATFGDDGEVERGGSLPREGAGGCLAWLLFLAFPVW